MIMDQVVAIVDMQFGSTGKGQVAGLLGLYWQPDTVVCANGPNAGHTFCWSQFFGMTGGKIICRSLPCSAVSLTVRNILIGPGAVLDVAGLLTEIKALGAWLKGKTLCIHPNVPVLLQSHAFEESKTLLRIGSTMKGTGEALVSKIRRKPEAILGASLATTTLISEAMSEISGHFQCNSQYYDRVLDSSRRCLIEGAQGFSLGIHTEFYPHTTSRDVSLHQLLADCRMPRLDTENLQVVGVVRTYPIRVANRYADDGQQVGTSGGCYDDQVELPWPSINREPELTTVTKLPRRLFSFSTTQLIEAARIMSPDFIVLNFCDYVEPKPELRQPLPGPVVALARRTRSATAAPVIGFGFGPNETDMLGVIGEPYNGSTRMVNCPAYETWARVLGGKSQWSI